MDGRMYANLQMVGHQEDVYQHRMVGHQEYKIWPIKGCSTYKWSDVYQPINGWTLYKWSDVYQPINGWASGYMNMYTNL